MKTLIKPFILLLVITSTTIVPAASHELFINPSAAGNDDTKAIGQTLNFADNISRSANGEIIFFEDFESGWGDWFTDHGVWEIGIPSFGPEQAYQETSVAGTDLSNNYPSQTDSHLISPIIILPAVDGDEHLELRYWQWYDYTGSDMGHVQIQTWNGREWTDWITVHTPTDAWFNSKWSLVTADLTDYAGQMVSISFYHTAYYDYWQDRSDPSPGWYIDEVTLWKGVPFFTNPETFESSWGDWHTDCGVWEVGVPKLGPGGAHEGRSAAATNLDGVYPPQTDSRLISPIVTLPTGPRPKLRFWQWYDYTGSDIGHVQIRTLEGSEWSTWDTIATPAPQWSSSDWSLVAIPLTSYAGKTVSIAFYHTAYYDYWQDRSDPGLGWYIDEVNIPGLEVKPPSPPTIKNWSVMDDTGLDTDDKITCDMTPELMFVFSKVVDGNDADIQIDAPDGLPVIPDSISGWGTNTIVVSFSTVLPLNGQYMITLKETINDGLGGYLNDGEDEILFFTLDTTPPALEVDDLVSVSLGSVRHDNDAEQTSAQITITNISSTIIKGPMWLILKATGDPEIALLDSHGTMVNGYEYIDVTDLLNDGQLDSSESVAKRLFFNNPQRKPFILTCEVLAQEVMTEME